MPNTSNPITIYNDTSTTTGNPVRLCYGFYEATGQRLDYDTLQNTASNSWTAGLPGAGSSLDWTRVGIWGLGEGPQNGCVLMNINGLRTFNSETDNPAELHYHPGFHGVIGSGSSPTSAGPDQGVDSFFTFLPSAVTELNFSGLCYYALKMKFASEYAIQSGADLTGSSAQENGNNWADLNPLALWRGLSCRIFDADGNQNAFAFTVNPAWHDVDVWLRRRIKPDCLYTESGPDPLATYEADCFDWECYAETAAYFDELLLQTDGSYRRRFEHHGVYDGATQMNDILTNIQLRCRSYRAVGAGRKLQLICDKPRASIFTFDRTKLLPGTYAFSDQKIASAPNQIRAKFRSLLVPAFGTIETISYPDHAGYVLFSVYDASVPCVAGDYVWVGGTGTNYDREWVLISPQPGGLAVNQFACGTQGSNFPALWSDAALPTDEQGMAKVGLTQSRLGNRDPIFDHKANQLARGAIGVGIPRQRSIEPQDVDFGTTTFDQAERLALYELLRPLGPDTFTTGAFTSPYKTPAIGKVSTEMFAQDVDGNVAIGIRPGDLVTLTPDVNYPNAMVYEVMDEMTVRPYTSKIGGAGAGLSATPSGGEIDLMLHAYDATALVDASDLQDASWQDVPNSDPDSGSNGTPVPLGDGGTLVFFSGGSPSGGQLRVPSGYPPTNFMGVTSPQGYIEENHDLHIINKCSFDPTMKTFLNYIDGEGDNWAGDSGFMGVSWISSTATYTAPTNALWLEVTLAGSGAEQILVGWVTNYGAGAAGTAGGFPSTITLPTGWDLTKMIAVAFPYNNGGAATSNHCHILGCSVDSSGNCTFFYEDGESHVWDAPVQVMILAWKNNGGTVTDATSGGMRWVSIPVGTTEAPLTFYFGAGVFSDQSGPSPPNPTVMPLPGSVAGTSLQAVVSPSSFTDDGNPTHGVRALYLDTALGMNASLEDGEGNIKYGNGTVLAVLCE